MVRVDEVCGANTRAHGRRSSRAAERDERDPRVDGWSLRSTMRVSEAETLVGLSMLQSRPLREVIGKQIVADIVITVES